MADLAPQEGMIQLTAFLYNNLLPEGHEVQEVVIN
jgi:hypothetical protein